MNENISNVVPNEEFQRRRKEKAQGPEGSLKGRFDSSTGQTVEPQLTASSKDAIRNSPLSETEIAMETEFNHLVETLFPSKTLEEQSRAQVKLRIWASTEWDAWKTLSPNDRTFAMESFIQHQVDIKSAARVFEKGEL